MPCLVHRTRAGPSAKRELYYLDVTETSLSGRIEIMLGDLGKLLPLDTDADGRVSRAEFEAGKSAVYDFFAPRVTFGIAGQAYPIDITGHEFIDAGFDTFAGISFTTGWRRRCRMK